MWKLFVWLFLIMAVGGGILREYKTRVWDGVGRYTVISFEDAKVKVRSIDPISNEAVSIELPGELQINTFLGKGVWRVEVLPELAKKNGWKWVGDSVANYLGIGYTSLQKDLNLWDRLTWWRLTKGVVWNDVPLEETSLVAESVEKDDEKVLGLDTKWSKKAREYFSATDLNTEALEVVIINTVKTPGLGAYAARIVDSSGMRVIMVKSDTSEKLDNCVIKVAREKSQSKSVKFLQNNFKCRLEVNEQIVLGEIELKLGSEYAKLVFGE